MKKKIFKYLKFTLCIGLIFSLMAPSYAALSASDGSAFITKAEFDAALADFNARLTTFEAGINSKIDSQVTSYLDRNGIWNKRDQLNGSVKYLCDWNTNTWPYAFGYWASQYIQGKSLNILQYNKTGLCVVTWNRRTAAGSGLLYWHDVLAGGDKANRKTWSQYAANRGAGDYTVYGMEAAYNVETWATTPHPFTLSATYMDELVDTGTIDVRYSNLTTMLQKIPHINASVWQTHTTTAGEWVLSSYVRLNGSIQTAYFFVQNGHYLHYFLNSISKASDTNNIEGIYNFGISADWSETTDFNRIMECAVY